MSAILPTIINNYMVFTLIILDLILGGIAFMFFTAIYVPEIKKTAAFNKLKAKERAELDQKLAVKEYFGMEIAAESIDKKAK